MGGVEVTTRAPTDADVVELATRMRLADASECIAATGMTLLETVRASVAVSAEAWATEFNGELVALWGVAPRSHSLLDGRVGVCWMMTTTTVDRYPKAFWAQCKRLLRELTERWDVLVNAIDCRHEQALRWAARLGARFDAPAPFGALGLPFRLFSLRKGDLRYV